MANVSAGPSPGTTDAGEPEAPGTPEEQVRTPSKAHGPFLRRLVVQVTARKTATAFYAALTCVVVLLFCSYSQRWPIGGTFDVPLAYIGGDAVAVLGVTRGFGDLPPPWDITVPRLNAPFGADWNDYPRAEKLLLYGFGLLHRLFTPGVMSNVAVLFTHWSAAVAFAWVARRMKVGMGAAAVGAILFAFSPFVIGRALGHLLIAVVWHVPLLLYVVEHLDEIAQSPIRRGRLAVGGLMLVTALQNPYYTILGLVLLALATVRSALRGNRAAALLGVFGAGVGVATFALAHANVFLHRFTHGSNPALGGRSLGDFLVWGLRVPDLFMPWRHPVHAWEQFARAHYFGAGNPVTENGFAFLGVVGCALLIALGILSLKRGLGGRLGDVPNEGWVVGFLLLFACAGGINYFLASLGFAWLRGTNRYSIVILCSVLFWGAREAARLKLPWKHAGVVALAGLMGVLEMFGRRPDDVIARDRLLARVTNADRTFGQALEKGLPQGGAVFQLPVVGFPETAPIEAMQDYEHFRPFLWTKNLRFSYGTEKGREREVWQRHVERLSPPEMIDYLEGHGFDSVIVHRRGYADRGEALEAAFQNAKLVRLAETEVGDMVAYRLTRRSNERPLDYQSVALGDGFQGWESDDRGRWSWSNGSARLVLFAAPRNRSEYAVTFVVESLVARTVNVDIQGRRMAQLSLTPGQFETAKFSYRPRQGETLVELSTDVPAQRPPNGDPRLLAFRVINPKVEAVARRSAR